MANKPTKSVFSLISIILVNLILMFIALKAGLSITQLIWLYWCEGIIIGLLQSLKVLSTESTSVSVLKYLGHAPPINLTLCFLLLQVPFHAFFALWIYYIEPGFDYVHGLLVMGAIIVAHELFFYLRDSRPWSEPDDLKNVIIESGIYFLRFVPLIALYHFMIMTQAGRRNKTLLIAEFMLFKMVSDVTANLIGERLLKRDTI